MDAFYSFKYIYHLNDYKRKRLELSILFNLIYKTGFLYGCIIIDRDD